MSVREDVRKRTSQRTKLFRLLRTGKWTATPSMIRAGGHRFGGRLFELRKIGCVIQTMKTAAGYQYRMTQGPVQRKLWP